jgi:hypothetical protein
MACYPVEEKMEEKRKEIKRIRIGEKVEKV